MKLVFICILICRMEQNLFAMDFNLLLIIFSYILKHWDEFQVPSNLKFQYKYLMD